MVLLQTQRVEFNYVPPNTSLGYFEKSLKNNNSNDNSNNNNTGMIFIVLSSTAEQLREFTRIV